MRNATGLWSPQLEKEVDCNRLLSNLEIDRPSKIAKPLAKVMRTVVVGIVIGTVYIIIQSLLRILTKGRKSLWTSLLVLTVNLLYDYR